MERWQQIESVIMAAIDDLNEHVAPEMRLRKALDEQIYGRGGKLDSLALVNFILDVEERINSELDVSVSLADDSAVSQSRSVFRTVSSLAEYIGRLVGEQ